MSRQNKVNPGQYTSAGRLSPDDLGRELRRQNGKATSAAGPQAERPAWETRQPSIRLARKARPPARPRRAKAAADRTVIGATHVTARGAKTPTGAAKKVVAKGTGPTRGTTRTATAAAARPGKATRPLKKTAAKPPAGRPAKRR